MLLKNLFYESELFRYALTVLVIFVYTLLNGYSWVEGITLSILSTVVTWVFFTLMSYWVEN